MTGKEAIAELKTRYFSMSQCLQVEELHKANEAIDIAIEALQTEPCEDCISRQAVLDELERCHITSGVKNQGVWNECVDSIMRTIGYMPSVQPEQRWIPCEKRMPEDSESVLFCDIDEDIMIGYHVNGRPKTHFSENGSWEDIKNVRAWMPLPEPYVPDIHVGKMEEGE